MLGNVVCNVVDMVVQFWVSDGYLVLGEEVVLSSLLYFSMDVVIMCGFVLLEIDGIWFSGVISLIDVCLCDVSVDWCYWVVMGVLVFEVVGYCVLVLIGINGGFVYQVLVNGLGWLSISVDCDVWMVGKVLMIWIEFQVVNLMLFIVLSLGDDNWLLGFKVWLLQFMDIGFVVVVVLVVVVQMIFLDELVDVIVLVYDGSLIMECLMQSLIEIICELVKCGLIWCMVLFDKNLVVCVVCWMWWVSCNLFEMCYQLDQICIDLVCQICEFVEWVDNIEIDVWVQECEWQKVGFDVDVIIYCFELNYVCLLVIEELVQQVEWLQEVSCIEYVDNLEIIVVIIDGLGWDVVVVLDILNKILSELVWMLCEFESVDIKLVGMDQVLCCVQQQGEEYVCYVIIGICEFCEQLYLLLQQQYECVIQFQSSIELSLQSVIEC